MFLLKWCIFHQLLSWLCRFVQEPPDGDPPGGVSVRPAGVAQPLPQLHQVHPRSYNQPADADLSRHQVGRLRSGCMHAAAGDIEAVLGFSVTR